MFITVPLEMSAKILLKNWGQWCWQFERDLRFNGLNHLREVYSGGQVEIEVAEIDAFGLNVMLLVIKLSGV